MKTICPLCGVEGLLQQRGNSSRIQHYQGFKDGKRIYSYHKLEVNGSKMLEVKSLRFNRINGIMAGGEGFEPSTPNLGGWCSIRTELLALETEAKSL